MSPSGQARPLKLPSLPFEVQLDGAEIEATLVYTPMAGGPWREEMVPDLLAALGKAGLRNVDRKALIAALPEVTAGRPFRVAQGVAPVAGRNGLIRCHFETDVAQRSWEADDKERADFRHAVEINSVERGQLLAEVVPPTPPVDGVTVFGKAIAGREGRAARLFEGANVTLDPDGQKAYAAAPGCAKIVRSRVSVDPVKVVNGNLDFRYGCVEFEGDVVVTGDVLETFTIAAGGSISVAGSVERSSLKAGGEIVVAGGLYGKEGVKVEAEGNVSVGFAENADVVAGGNVYVRNSMINCTAAIGGKLFLKSAGKSLVGGKVTARCGVVAGSLGNPNVPTKTIVEFGPDPELARELKALDLALGTAGDKEQHKALEEKREGLVETLTRQARAHVVARHTTYPGVVLVNGKVTYQVTTEISGISYSRLPGRNEIVMRAYGGEREM